MAQSESGQSEDRLITRRNWIVSLGSGFIGFVFGDSLDKIDKNIGASHRLWAKLVDARRQILELSGIDRQARLNLLAKLLRISGNVHILPPTGHPLYHRPGPSDIAAMGVASSLLTNPRVEADGFGERLHMSDGLFSAGSPVSSILAATFVPTAGNATRHETQLVVNKAVIPYHFLEGRSNDLIVKSATIAGRVRQARNNGLCIGGANWYPQPLTDEGAWLKTDFLLLTVLPWSKEGGGYAAFVSGGHGPGTRAFELLLNPNAFPLENLEALVADLDEAQAFQVVFEVSVIHTGICSMPSSIRVSSQCPPQKIKSIQSLFLLSTDRVDEIVLKAIEHTGSPAR
jgi:hypothetical protein